MPLVTKRERTRAVISRDLQIRLQRGSILKGLRCGNIRGMSYLGEETGVFSREIGVLCAMEVAPGMAARPM